jgi:hypothetical protein
MSKNDKKIFYKTLVMSNDINFGGNGKGGRLIKKDILKDQHYTDIIVLFLFFYC